MTTNDERSAPTAEPTGDDRGAATDQQEAPATPGAPTHPPQRRLVRLEDGAPGAGVAAGLGAYFGVDPVLFRLAFVVLAFAGGVGIVLYLAGWIAMPKGTAADVAGPPPSPPDRTTQWLVVGLAATVGLLLLVQAPFGAPWPGWGGPFVWAVALIVLGVVLFRWDAGRRSGPPASPAPGPGAPPPPTGGPAPSGSLPAAPPAAGSPPAGAAGAPPPGAKAAGGAPQPPASVQTALGGPAGGGPAAPPPLSYAPPPSPPKPTPPPSILGRVATGAGLLVLGLAALLDNAGALDLAAYHYVALALTVSGVALLVGSRWGRARGFIAVGLLLLPLLVLTSLFGGMWGRDLYVGQRLYQPETVSEVDDEYRMVAGELTIDLTGLDFTELEHFLHVDAAVIAGQLVILVPDDVNVSARGRTGAGELELFGIMNSGLNVRRSATVEAVAGAPSLDIDARVGTGQVHIIQDSTERLLP